MLLLLQPSVICTLIEPPQGTAVRISTCTALHDQYAGCIFIHPYAPFMRSPHAVYGLFPSSSPRYAAYMRHRPNEALSLHISTLSTGLSTDSGASTLEMPSHCKLSVNSGPLIHRVWTEFSPLFVHRNTDSARSRNMTKGLRICIFSPKWSEKGRCETQRPDGQT